MTQNDYFAVSFDSRTGTLSVRRSDGAPFLTGGTACANTAAGRQSTATPGRRHSVDTRTFRDHLGSGQRLVIDSRDPQQLLDLRVQVDLYDSRPMVTIEAQCTNVSSEDAIVNSLEPIRAIAAERGSLRVPGVTACLTNGEMYSDPGTVHSFAVDPPSGLRPPLAGAPLVNESISAHHPTVASWWNITFFSGYDREGVVLGYLENTVSLGAVLASRTSKNEIGFLAESAYAPPITLRPGRSIGSNRFMLSVGATPYAALQEYAASVGTAQNARTRSIVNGWCSWFYTLTDVSEGEVLRNAEFAAQELGPFGLEYIQIDEGYQRAHGDWEGNERFPHGMKWLAEKIKEHGLKPGIWISPYVISEQSEVYQRHQDWLVHRTDGSLQRIGNWPDEDSPAAQSETVKRYCLDITNPQAAEWLRDLFETVARRWGFEMIKIDFMAWSVLAAERFQDPTVSSAEVYRRGASIMRAAAGERCHILECGPGNTTVGLIDSMRIEADVFYGYAAEAWRQYFNDPASSTAAAAKRYYFHRRTWVNDVEQICIDLLTPRQARAVATLIAFSGGNTITGDRLVDLDPAKVDILKKIMPSYGEAAVPVDLFDSDVPTTFVLRVERPFAAWSLVAFFNRDLDAPTERRFPLHRLGLDPATTYLAFDFWKQQFVGEVTNELSAGIEAGGVTLLALHAATGTPQFLSTSRHVVQGAIELDDLRWHEGPGRLSGISTGHKQSAHDVFVYVPGDRPWTWEGRETLIRDKAGYSLRLVDPNVIRVHVRFDDDTRVHWHVDADNFAS